MKASVANALDSLESILSDWSDDMKDRAFSCLSDAIEAVRNADAWAPIDTAPKDGSEILGFNRYGPRADHFCIYTMHWDGGWDADSATSFAEPSHWMPLPEPLK